MNNDALCCFENIGKAISETYDKYRELTELMSNYIMCVTVGYTVYITEHDIDIFELHFCSKEDDNKTFTILLRKKQLEDMDCILKEIIIPELNNLDSCHC